MKVGYFPGCSLHATAREFDLSLRAVASGLGIELDEVDDWSCCGATSGHATNHLLGVALASRNLARAEAQAHDRLLAPCAACYSRLASADHELREDPSLRERVAGMLDRAPAGSVRPVSVVEFLRDLPDLGARIRRPLTDLRLACYYGCLLVRPPEITGWDDPEQPSSMETVVRAAGAEPVAWNRRLDCCGGGFSLSRPGSVVRLGRTILDDARAAGAAALVVACPMCHSNLDFRQRAMARQGEAPLPVLFITQVVGLALGLPAAALGLDRHFVDPRPLVADLEAPAASAGEGA